MNNRNELKDAVYMQMAKDISKLSRDENTKIGCVIVGKYGSPVSWGYNGTISGINDNTIPHSREEKEIKYKKIDSSLNETRCSVVTNKYPWMKHAEVNAINFADASALNGATLYVTAFPCSHCALRIASTGITRMVVNNIKTIDPNSSLNADHDLSEAILAQKFMEICINGNTIKLSPSIK